MAKPRRCKVCGAEYEPGRTFQKWCSPKCAIELVKRNNAAKRKKENREERRKLKTRTEWLNDARDVFNAYIRARDADQPCISCGTTANVQYAAGHYRTVAAAGHLRFDERNVHKQCNKNCNKSKSGNIVEYRKNLIKKIGIEAVESLENDNTIKRWTIEEAKQIIAEYRKKLRDINRSYDV